MGRRLQGGGKFLFGVNLVLSWPLMNSCERDIKWCLRWFHHPRSTSILYNSRNLIRTIMFIASLGSKIGIYFLSLWFFYVKVLEDNLLIKIWEQLNWIFWVHWPVEWQKTLISYFFSHYSFTFLRTFSFYCLRVIFYLIIALAPERSDFDGLERFKWKLDKKEIGKKAGRKEER